MNWDRFRYLLLLPLILFPFQKPILHKWFKKVSAALIPSDLTLPSYFSKTLAFFPTEFVLLGLLCIALRLLRGQWWDFFFAGPSKYLTLLFLVLLFSIGASPAAHYLLMYTRWLEIAVVMVLFHAMRVSLDAHSLVKFAKGLAWCIFAISLFECGVAILQYFMQHRVGLKWIGECDMQLCTFEAKQKWIFDAIWHRHTGADHLARASGTFPHPNIFGGFHFCAILATCYLYFVSLSQRCRMFLKCAIPVQICTLTIIFSRAAVLALLLSMSFWFILQIRNKEKFSEVKHLILTVLISGISCVIVFFPPLYSRGGFVNYNHIVQGADAERVTYQKVALEMVKEHPWFGVGFNNFQIASPQFFPSERPLTSKVHNIYLLIASESGLIGLTLFLAFLFSILKNAWHCTKSQEGLFFLSVFLGFLFIGLCDFYFISTPHGQILFFTLAALTYRANDQKHLLPVT